MNKLTLSTLVAALAYVAAGTANAADGISSSTLSAMGFSDLAVMSDSDALAIRGKGYSGAGGHRSRGCDKCGPRGKKQPWSAAFGNSFATIETKDGVAHSENGYAAEGPYAASGENFSEAGFSQTNVEIVDIDGIVKSVTTTCTKRVFAGGFSSAMSF